MEIKKRSGGYIILISEPAKSRIENNQCPSCGKHKDEWNRRTDWRCCSPECTMEFECKSIIRSWPELRMKALKRDNFTCVKCKLKPKARRYSSRKDKFGNWESYWIETDEENSSELIGDHITPIALGGDEWDLDNIQTLCKPCDKIKTKQDLTDIAKVRRISKTLKTNSTL